MPLKIRMPVTIEVSLDDDQIANIAARIREDDGREDDDDITNDEIKQQIVADFNDDPESFISEHSPDQHLDENNVVVIDK